MTPLFAFDPLLWRYPLIINTTGAADVTVLDSAFVPDDELWFILTASCTTSDATARRLDIGIITESGSFSALNSITSTAGLSSIVPIRWPFLLSPNFALRARANALSLGATITLSFMHIKLRKAGREAEAIWTLPRAL